MRPLKNLRKRQMTFRVSAAEDAEKKVGGAEDAEILRMEVGRFGRRFRRDEFVDDPIDAVFQHLRVKVDH